MKTAEGRGRTLDEAVDAALIQLAESRRNVDVKVLSENSDETVVEVTVIGAGAAVPGSSGAASATSAGGDVAAGAGKSQADNARDIVDQLLSKMGIRCQVTTRATPEAMTAGAHAGVRPTCTQGSSVRYRSAPRAPFPAAASAAISAGAPPARRPASRHRCSLRS